MRCKVPSSRLRTSNSVLTCAMTQILTTIGICKPLVSWNLSCTAARMVQSLGCHRLGRKTSQNDPLLERKVGDYARAHNVYVKFADDLFLAAAILEHLYHGP